MIGNWQLATERWVFDCSCRSIVERECDQSDIYERIKTLSTHAYNNLFGNWLIRRTTVDRLRPLCLYFVVLTVFFVMAHRISGGD